MVQLMRNKHRYRSVFFLISYTYTRANLRPSPYYSRMDVEGGVRMIRRAVYRTDRESIVRLVYRELWPFTRRTFPGRRFSRKDVLQRLRIRHVFVKVGKNGDILGFIMAATVRGGLFIDLLAVDRQVQHQGIGATLMSVIERMGRRNGLTYATLFVDDSNMTAMRFYEKLGYVRSGYVIATRCYVYQKPLSSIG